jgi:diguanylate cyclase (GGDEF)-like protein
VDDHLIFTSMLKNIIQAIPSAIMTVNDKGRIIHLYTSKTSNHQESRCTGQLFLRILKLIFGTKSAETIYTAYQESRESKKTIEISKLKHTNFHGLPEYFKWVFSPVRQSDFVAVFVNNITENVLIEEEFTSMSEQYESVNRELSVALSNLDFHLMDIEQAHKKVAALYRVTSIVQRTVNEQEVLNEILDGITRELSFTNVAIMLLDEKEQVLKTTAYRGQHDGDCEIPVGVGITGYAAKHRELVYVKDVKADLRYIGKNASCGGEVAVPLIVDDKVVGVLNIDLEDGRILQPYELDLLRSLASQMAMTIVHASHVSRVEVQATTDGLTGLYNYRYFHTVLEQEFKRALRYNRPLSFLMIDIDYFKHYNDQNGHRMGDEVLVSVATLIKQCCRDLDFVIRYGGEEFAVLLPETKTVEALAIAERIRKTIAEFPFIYRELQPAGKLTVSIGVAGYPFDATSGIELIDHADNVLYRAKKCRNQVCLYKYESVE